MMATCGDSVTSRKALAMLDSAIQIEPKFIQAYYNKSSVLMRLKQYNDAIRVNKFVLEELSLNSPEASNMIALLYDKIGNEKLAKEFYNKSIINYSLRIKHSGKTLDIVSKAHIMHILKNKSGLKLLDSLISTNPENEYLKTCRHYRFIGYNHQKFLNQL